ncbi:Uncharacterized protein ALO80_02482 [Pseudomonas caricapapayae]|uniref:Uncharacterized protein n=2 Tax=Pseudomonas caricapapayae TaxID=46678 RepID=A0A0P9KAX7_9PSED|nr:Uncharacterized protein ALO80_02482 [Pseudomonas caricapapayae]RMM12135.1 hypothetical protein ALQ84_02720 [Pseudomonas caricapapayae]
MHLTPAKGPFMASPDKQQKRAKRAKIKAKQNRSGKAATSLVHPVFASALVNQPFDDVELDLNTFDFGDIVENGFDPADYDDLFTAMKAAEAISQLALCVVFLQYPVLALVVSEEEEDPATDFMMGLLIVYRAMYHDEDEDTAIEWIESPAFQKDYTLASDLLMKRDTRAAR